MASAERTDLLAIGEALNIFDSKDESKKQCDNIALLKVIIGHIKSAQQDLSRQLNKHDAALKNIGESFAFTPKARGKVAVHEDPNSMNFWLALSKLNEMLRQDYTHRRAMLLNRLDCTVESFKWKNSNNDKPSRNNQGTYNNDKTKTVNDLIQERYESARLKLRNEPQISLAHLLAVRDTESGILLNSVVSSRSVDCKISYKSVNESHRAQNNGNLTYLKQVLIPDVPDRGGRPNEIKPPKKETFNQQHRHNKGRGGFRR